MENRSIREKMANLSRKEKISYIWEYFKYHIIGSIVAIAILISIISSILNQTETVLGITIMGKTIDSAKLEELQVRTTTQLIEDNPKNKKIIRYDYLMITNNALDEYSRASRDKFTLSIAAKEMDIVILDKKDFEAYVKQGMFFKLDSTPKFTDLSLKNYETLKAKIEDDNNSEGIYGISVENLPILKELKFDANDKVMCIISNTNNIDKSFEYIQWILSQTSI